MGQHRHHEHDARRMDRQTHIVIDKELEVQKTIERHWRAMERERIIKLLEEQTYSDPWNDVMLSGEWEKFIALIKGEE